MISSAKKFGINAISTVMTRIIQVTVLVWVNQYLIKRIPAEEYSLLPLLLSLLVFGELFRSAFVSGIGRYIVEADSKEGPEAVTRVVSSVVPFLLGLAVLLAGLAGLAIWFVTDVTGVDAAYESQARIMLGFLVFPLLAGIIGSPFAAGLYAQQKFVVLNLVDLFCEALRVTIVVGCLLGVSVTVLWLAVASCCASVVNLLIRILMTRRVLPAARFCLEAFSVSTARSLFGFSSWTAIGSLVQMTITTFPVLLLGHFATAVEVACYHLGRLPDVNIRRMALAAISPAQPALTEIYAKNGMDGLSGFYFQGGRYHLWATLFLVAPLVVFAQPIIKLYAGRDYSQAAWVFVILFARYPIIWASAMFYRVTHANGEVGRYYRCEIITVIGTLICLGPLVVFWELGAVGAALAVVVPSILTHLFLIWKKGLETVGGTWMAFFRKTLIPGILPFAAATVFSAGYAFIVSLDNWLEIGCGAFLACGVYLMVLLFFGCDEDDRMLIRRVREVIVRLIEKIRSGRASRSQELEI